MLALLFLILKMLYNLIHKSGNLGVICLDYVNRCPLGTDGLDGKKAVYFGGSREKRDQITLVNTFDYSINDGITAEAWVRPEVSDYYGYMAVISKGGSNRRFFSFALFVDRINNRLRTQVRTLDGRDIVVFSPSDSVSMSEWHHVAMSYDGFTLKLFLDGKLVNQQMASILSSAGLRLA